MKRKWRYESFNFGGNLHYLRGYLNEQEPEIDVVAIHFTGSGCVVLHRVPADREEGDLT